MFSSSSFELVFLFITVRTIISQDPFLVQELEISKLVMVKENGKKKKKTMEIQSDLSSYSGSNTIWLTLGKKIQSSELRLSPL